MEYKDYYETLGVERSATEDEIKRAYRKLARKYHPDVSKDPNADERFKTVGEAYEVLKDPSKRAAYDQLGSDWHTGQEFRPPPDWERSFSFGGPGAGGMDGFASSGAFSDFFETLFRQPHVRRDQAFQGAFQGTDARARVNVTLEQLVAEQPVELTLEQPVTNADGSRTVQRKRLSVRVPSGLREGQSFRLKGQGAPGIGGGPAGDLYIELVFIPHPTYETVGLDVHSEVTIAPWQAVLGGEVSADTLKGTVKLKVPAGSKSGSRLRLGGRGLPGKPSGDQYVTLKIDVPTEVSDEQRLAYEELARVSQRTS
ncbi:MAG: DnaJ domain-containing protein [Gammaproteobacteria bacterium]|nr:DnaJ domain-containing protein [Gammaproteobacteria bacterium]